MPLPTGVNLADKFSSKLDDAFKLSSYTDSYINKDYDFDGVNKIKVYSLDTADLVDYDMSNNTNRYGGFSEVTDTVNEYTLSHDKAFQKTLDKANEQDSVSAKTAAKFLARQMNFRIVPLIDRDRFATAFTAAQDTDGGGTEAYSAADLLDQIRAMNAVCDEMSVPDAGRAMFIDSFGWNDVKDLLTPILNDTSDKVVRTRGLGGTVDGINIVKVPSNLLPSGCRALFWHKDALLAARKLTETKILDGSFVVSGNIIQGRVRYDSWALKGYDNSTSRYTKLGTFQALTGTP